MANWKITVGENYDAEQAERVAVFKKIAPKDNWKQPIRATIDAADFDECNEAAVFFTGGPIEIAQRLPDGRLVVAGYGYYIHIGA